MFASITINRTLEGLLGDPYAEYTIMIAPLYHRFDSLLDAGGAAAAAIAPISVPQGCASSDLGPVRYTVGIVSPHDVASGPASGFKLVSGPSLEAGAADCAAHGPVSVVTDNKDDLGAYLMESEGIGWKTHTRPFSDGLIAYNGHAGLGALATAAERVPGRLEYPNIR